MKKLSLLLALVSLLNLPLWSQSTQDCPCCTEKYKEFDFWVGSWNVYTMDGKLAGLNTVEKEQGNCVLRESWVSSQSKMTGTSLNFFDAKQGKWRQTWIDNQGTVLELAGSLQQGKMVLVSDLATNDNGDNVLNKITWTPNDDGTVIQRWETSTNYGETWKIVFEGVYKKR
jgi:hypothetical protein